jgi:hypothetical protein
VEFDIHSEGSVHKGTYASFADAFRIHLSVESPEPPEVVAHIIQLAQQSCYAEALVQTPLEIAHTYTVNGESFQLTGE